MTILVLSSGVKQPQGWGQEKVGSPGQEEQRRT